MTNKQKFELLVYMLKTKMFSLEEVYENRKTVSMIFKQHDQENYLTIYEEKTKEGLEVQIIYVGEEEENFAGIKRDVEKIYNKYLPKNLVSVK